MVAIAVPLASSALSAVACNQNDVTTIVQISESDPVRTTETSTLVVEARRSDGQACTGVALDYGDELDTDGFTTTSDGGHTTTAANDQATDANGRVTWTRPASGANAAIDWRVWADINPDNDTFDGGEATLTGAYESYAAAATTVTLTQTAGTDPAPTGTNVTYRANVDDQKGRDLAGVDVAIDVTGANTANADGNTDANGNLDITYNGANAGADTVCASVDGNANNVCDDGINDTEGQTFQNRTPTSLNAEPEAASRPVGGTHTFLVTLLDQFGTGTVNESIDAKILSGPNAGMFNVSDQRDFECTTDDYVTNPDKGRCRKHQGEGQLQYTDQALVNGTDVVCIWADTDNDNFFSPSGAVNDGGDCDTETVGGDGGNTNTTDVVTRTWTDAPGPPARIDCTPETDSNVTGNNHAINCTVMDANNNPVGVGIKVDVELTGAGDGNGDTPQAPDQELTTDNNGNVTINHNSAARGTTNYRAWIDADNNNSTVEADTTEGQNEATTPGGTPEGPNGDNTDVVSKTWTGPAFALTMTPDTDSASVGTCNSFTVTIVDSDGTPVKNAGFDVNQNFDTNATADEASIDFCGNAADVTGPNPTAGGNDDGSPPGNPDTETAHAEFNGTNTAGQLSFGVTSDKAGTVAIEAFVDNNPANNTKDAGEPNDSSTKTWTAGGTQGVTQLDAEPESDSNPDGTNHTVTVTLKNAANDPVSGIDPDAVVTAGPNAGASTSGGGVSCTTSNNAGVSICTWNGDAVAASPSGTDTLRVFVNTNDARDTTPGADANEPQDDVDKTWTARATGLAIDLTCQGKGATDDFDATDRQVENQLDCRDPLTDTTVRFQARVYNPGSDPATFDDVNVSGQQVEFTITARSHAGINFTGDSTGPIYCTTQADGTCSVEVTNSAASDFDLVRVLGTVFGQTNTGTQGNNSDEASKEWQVPRTETVDVTPDAATNKVNTNHTVTIKATDQYGNGVNGENIDLDITGRNNLTFNDLFTGADGTVQKTYTDGGQSNADGSDDITAVADNNPENDTQDGGEASDTARKDWRQNVPAADQVSLDMEGCDGDQGNPDSATWEAAASDNPVNTTHELCASVFDVNNDLIIGSSVTFTLSGPGHFTNAAGTSNLGNSITVPMGDDDYAHTFITSSESGTTTITATSGSKSDSGTKKWLSLAGRNIDCTPETAQNEPGTNHNIDCLVVDRVGNPVINTPVVFQLTGQGVIQNPACFNQQQTTCVINTDANGIARLVIKSDTEGNSTVTATLQEDTVGEPDTDECDRPANDPTGAPAGNCADVATKAWVDALPQCDDDIDNDGDGFIDFNGGAAGEANDPGCDSATDDSEAPFNPGFNQIEHTRTAKITKFKHLKQGGKKSLLIKGTVETDDGETLCSSSVPVKIQFRAGGEWVTKKSDTTSSSDGDGDGAYIFKVSVQDVTAKYRVVAVKHQVQDPSDATTLHICKKAIDEAKHTHG